MALHVAGGKGTFEPGCAFATDGLFLVVEAVVAEDLRFRIVGGGDLGATVDQAMGLVEVDGGGDVFGDDFVVLPRFRDAVDLNCQQDWNANSVQFAGEHDYGGGSPTVAEEDDAGLRFFLVAEDAVVVAVEFAEDCVVGGAAVAVLEDLDLGVGQGGAHVLSELYGAVVGVVVADEASGEADENVRGGCCGMCGYCTIGG